MDKEFLMGLSLNEETAQAILEEHGKALQEADFQHRLGAALIQARGRSQKAITALLDLDALRQAEDPKAVNGALAALKKEHGYLFEQSAAPYDAMTGVGRVADVEPTTLAGALRERFSRKK